MRVRLERPSECRFDERKAERAVRFFREYLHHTKGRWAGKPFIPYPFQEIDIREIYGRVDEKGYRVIRQVYKEEPKKSGKSEEAAGHALKLLCADDEHGAEIYGAAADRDQASIVFGVAQGMVQRHPELKRICKLVPSTKRLVVREDGSFYRALSSDVAGKHGFNAHGVIFDEVHAQKDMRLWEVLTFGAGDSRTQPLVFAITTAGVPGESPVAEMLHEEAVQILRGIVPCPAWFYPVVYAAPEGAPWEDERTWYDCNPAMHSYKLADGTTLPPFLSIQAVREAFQKAKLRPVEQNSFRRLRLNQWVSQETRWIDLAAWDACRGAIDHRALRGMSCYAGLDLSTTTDITSLVLDFIGDGIHYVVPYFWLPEENVLDKCKPWARQGLISLSSGNVIDYDQIRRRINELASEFEIDELAYDPWNATQLALQLQNDGLKLAPVRQGFASLSAPTKELERLVLDRRIRHDGNPVLRWMADCMTVKQDAAGNIKPVKPDRLRSMKRIDGMVALIMAIDRAMRNEGPSVYEARGVVMIWTQ